MTEKEPDSTPIRQDHVERFLAWYRGRVHLSDIAANVEWWTNAMRGLTLGDMRRGIESYKRFTTQMPLTPVQFHGLCRGQQSQQTIERFRQLREVALGRKKNMNVTPQGKGHGNK